MVIKCMINTVPRANYPYARAISFLNVSTPALKGYQKKEEEGRVPFIRTITASTYTRRNCLYSFKK
jgi:hypothetical protein